MSYKNILDCVDIINNRIKPYDDLRVYLDTGGLQIDVIEETREFDYDNKPSRANQNVRIDDIILARMKETTKVKVISNEESDFMVSTGFIVLRAKKNITDVSYLNHILLSDSFQRDKDELCTGATQKAINNTNFKKLKIFLPPLDQQKKIASILDSADAYRQKTKALIDKYEQLSQSLFLEMFGDPVTNPKAWDEKLLFEVCLKITDGTHHSPKPQKSGFPYVTAKHVRPFKLDFESKPTFVSEEAHNEIYKRCTPEYGDVLYIKDGATTGIACINTFEQPISMLSSLALLKLSPEINNQFLCHWLNYDGIKQKLISKFMSGAAIKRYTLKKIKSFEMMIPPIELQTKFAERVKAIEAQKFIAQQSLIKSEELFNSLLQKAFKGELI